MLVSDGTGHRTVSKTYNICKSLHAICSIFLALVLVFSSLMNFMHRIQIINVYNQEYESAAAFWPDVHGRIITALVVSQLLLMGLLSTKKAAQSTPLLITLPILTIWFHLFCKGRYEPAFVTYPLQVCPGHPGSYLNQFTQNSLKFMLKNIPLCP